MKPNRLYFGNKDLNMAQLFEHSHLILFALILQRILSLALPPQLFQVSLRPLQRVLLHLVLHLILLKCGLRMDRRLDHCLHSIIV